MSTGPTPILVVDDEDAVRAVLARILTRAGYEAVVAANPAEARVALATRPFALVLCDLNMPGESGFGLARTIRAEHPDTALLMVTAADDALTAEAAFELGAYGYIIKPFEPTEILVGVSSALRRRAAELENEVYRRGLEELVDARTAALTESMHRLESSESHLRSAYEETINRLASAAELRDDQTGTHLRRMSELCGIVARRAGFAEADAELLRLVAPMHDIGKIGIPDAILLSTGRFTPEERTIMERHPEIGYGILAGSTSPLLQKAAVVARTHHEKWDGSGYPRGLAGEAIPIDGRIAAVADVFDALITARRYKPAFDFDEAVGIVVSSRGSHFDPFVVDAFVDARDEILTMTAELERSAADAVEPPVASEPGHGPRHG